MKNYQQQVLEIVQKAVEQAGNQNKLATAMGTDRAKICKWLAGTSPNTKDFAVLAEYVGAQIVLPGQSIRDYARLLQVEDIDAFNHQNDKKTEQNVPESVLEYVAQKKHRQPGLLFSLDMLEGLGLDAADGLLFTPQSDVMHPIISRGDQVLINRKNTQIEDGKIYLIHTVNHFVLRYVSRDLSGDLILHTPGHIPEMRVSPESLEGFEIIGQVVWIGHFC